MIHFPERVKICECWARDGLQGEDQFIPTEKKIAILNRMVEIGFKRIEATSFAHPRLIRQFSDSLEVLKGIQRPPDVTFIAIIPNDKGLDRLLEACDQGYGVQEITAILSASEDHLLANLERTFEEAMPPLADVVKRARQAGLKVIGCIGTAFGCPLAGEVPLGKIIELTDWYLKQGATSIMLGDTTGEANPKQVREVFGKMQERFPGVDFIAHFHDTRGMGLANTLAALQEGIVYHDSSFGGMGGQPATRRPKYHKGFAGNTCTEDMVVMMEEMGIETGLQIQEVIETALMAEEICGRELLGHVTRSGPIRHRSPQPLSPQDFRLGWEVPPALFSVENLGARTPRQDLPGRVIREALEKIWPLPAGLGIDLDGVLVKSEIEERTILVTRFKPLGLEKEKGRAFLEVLSQKANGDIYLQGQVKLVFP
ncbi:MAG: hydroxymethylglutaryl-CoA lyase [Thermodesulfobacteriota bacterium]|nr:hydroxymethylglutaryl-CoA lyase [Thermodesulfobacteriota bacterium]